MLKIDLIRQPTGEYEDLEITCPSGEVLVIKVAGTNPRKVWLKIEGPREIQVHTNPSVKQAHS